MRKREVLILMLFTFIATVVLCTTAMAVVYYNVYNKFERTYLKTLEEVEEKYFVSGK